MSGAKLKKATGDNSVNIHVYRPFWTDKLENNLTSIPLDTVHPILIYADLIASADSRNLETARMLYDSTIAEYIGKD